MGKLTRAALAATLTAGLLLGLVPVAAAAEPATFGTPTAKSTFNTGIVFSQPITISQPIGRAEMLLTIADAIGPEVVDVPVTTDSGATTLTYTLDTSGPAHMIPNTGIVARWRLYAAGDPTAVALGPELRLIYADDRFQWKTTTSNLVRVHWYDGTDGFAAKALRLGEDEVVATSKLLGVTETQPVDFFVYGNVDDFYGALGPGAHENVAGTAFANIRTLLGLIPPDQIDDPLVAVRIPHEFVHLVFNTAADNPYHFAPRWLNEGLAVYQSESYGTSDRGQVRAAAAAGSLIPLDGLTGQFPNGDDFFLAYSESVSAVDFMIRTYGSPALVKLIRSYGEGRTDNEAFKDALGLDMTAFGAAWFADNNATPKARSGPESAPPGPVPSAWLGAIPGSSGAPAGSGAIPGNSGVLGGFASPIPGATPASSDSGLAQWIGLVVVIVIVGLVVIVVAARRRQKSERAP